MKLPFWDELSPRQKLYFGVSIPIGLTFALGINIHFSTTERRSILDTELDQMGRRYRYEITTSHFLSSGSVVFEGFRATDDERQRAGFFTSHEVKVFRILGYEDNDRLRINSFTGDGAAVAQKEIWKTCNITGITPEKDGYTIEGTAACLERR